MNKLQDQKQVNSQEIKVESTRDNHPMNSTPEEDTSDVKAEMKFLARTWLDDFEKNVFNGKTVNELLNQGRYE